MLVFFGFIGILLLVIAHEAGHFWAARRNGIEVEEFGIGFPPKAKVLTKKNGTEYTLNWLPLGGFVKLKGEHDNDTTPGSFGAARLRDKVKVMVAGVAVNFVIAFLLFTLLALVGMPRLLDNQFTVPSDTKIVRQDVIVAVGEQSPAGRAGLENGDVVRKIEQTSCVTGCIVLEIEKRDDIIDKTQQLAGQDVVVTHERAGEILTTTLTLNTEEFVARNEAEVDACLDDETIPVEDCPEYQSYLGIIPQEHVVRRSTWSAPIVGAGVSIQFTRATLSGLGTIFGSLLRGDTQPAREQATGVLGIGFILSGVSFLGVGYMLMIIAVISLTLAIMNILPIPALDGGRLFVTLLYRLRGKELTKEVEERIHGTGFAALMILFVLITILDVQRFIL